MDSVPAAVMEQERRSEELLEKMQKGEVDPGSYDSADDQPLDIVGAPQPILDPAAPPDPLTGEPATPPLTGTEEAPTVDLAEAQAETDYWRRRCETVQGKYNAEVPALMKRVDGLEHGYQTKLQEMEEANRVAPHMRHLSKEDADMMGLDIVGATSKIAQGHAEDATEKLSRELNGRLDQMDSSLAQNAHQNMMQSLTFMIPDWERINNEPAFVEWLNQKERFGNTTRHEALQDAFTRKETGLVAEFFNAFKTEAGYETQADPRAGQIVPRKGRSAAPVKPQPKPIIDAAQIKQFYNDVRRGKFQGKDEEKDAIENQIMEAQMEGRIRR